MAPDSGTLEDFYSGVTPRDACRERVYRRPSAWRAFCREKRGRARRRAHVKSADASEQLYRFCHQRAYVEDFLSLSGRLALTPRLSGATKPSTPVTVGVLMNSFLRTEGPNAGGHVHTLEVAQRWARDGFEIVIFAPGFAEAAVRKRLTEARYVAMPTTDHIAGRVGVLLSRAVLSFSRRKELARCEALFASSAGLADVFPLLFAPRSARVVFVAHVLDRPWQRRGSVFWNALASINEALGLFVLRFACDAVVTCSEFVAGQLNERHVRRPCYVTTNGVDHLRTRPHTQRSGGLCVARLHPTKGIDDLLRAWVIVAQSVPNAILRIVGGGELPYRERLDELAASLRLGTSVLFAGGVSDEERDEYISHANVFLFPSYEEGWGIAVAEAMAAGLPCITYDLPVFREIFPRGRLTAPLGDVEGLARAAITLLQDEDERERLSAEALHVASNFTWERAAELDGRAVLDSLERKRKVSGHAS